MKQKLLIILFIIGSLTQIFAQDDELFWHHSYTEALAEAQKTRKPIFLVFR